MGRRLITALPRPVRCPSGKTPDFELVDPAIGGEYQNRRMGVGSEVAGDEIFFLGRHSGEPLATAALRPKVLDRRALDVPGVGNRHDHFLLFDQGFVFHFSLKVQDFGAARRRVGLRGLAEVHLPRFPA